MTGGAGRSTLTPVRSTRCLASTSCVRPTRRRCPATTGASPSRPSWRSRRGRGGTADFRQIPLALADGGTAYHRPGAPDLYPEKLREQIEEISDLVYEDLNNGVYRCGFATTQAAYEEAYGKLFGRLDWLSERLATRRYLAGDTITEADIRLWPTLVRFDAVYHGHFKCNRSK